MTLRQAQGDRSFGKLSLTAITLGVVTLSCRRVSKPASGVVTLSLSKGVEALSNLLNEKNP
jgi:hypothetical protein